VQDSKQAGHFTAEEIAQYTRDGFIFVRGMYSEAEITQAKSWIANLAGRTPELGEQMVYFEDSLLEEGTRVLTRIERFAGYHPQLTDLVLGEEMVRRASDLLGEQAVLFKEKVNFKEPGGGGFTPHQDVQAGWKTYGSRYLSVLVTIDESTEDNGCLEIAAGHHKKGLIGQEWKPLEGEVLDNIDFVRHPTKPGDVAFFDGYTPHQSQPNLSDRTRWNMYLTFNPASQGDHREIYFADKRESYPPDNERDPNKTYHFRV